MAELDEMFDALPEPEEGDALDFVIDKDLRVIAVPKRGVVLGVEGDKNVNRVQFAIDRYYHGNDLSEFVIRINYENAEGERNYFTVTEMTVGEDRIRFVWTVDVDAVAHKGSVYFVVNCFIAAQDGAVEKAYHTTLGTASVLEGMEVDAATDTPEVIDLLTRLEHDLTVHAGTLIAQAEEAAQNAAQSRDDAAASAAEAHTSEANAGDSAAAAGSSAHAAAVSESSAASSAANAGRSEANAGDHASAAESSAVAAKGSETSAASSAAASADSAAAAKTSEDNAASSAAAAHTSEDNAASSASAAQTSETNAAASKEAALASEQNAKASEEAAARSAAEAKAAGSTDETLELPGVPADAKAVGDALAEKAGRKETETALDGKADKQTTEKALAGKADKKETETALEGKSPTDHTHSAMTGASASAAGATGFVPAPAAGKQAQFLRGDGTWATPEKTTYSAATQSAAGLMSAADKKRLDNLYPVGSIYMSTSSTSPASLYGGTWEEIASERVLMGRSSTHAAGTTVAAGLPNITGSTGRFVSGMGYYSSPDRAQGALSYSGNTSGGWPSDSGNYGEKYYIDFNASKSNAIYGKSSTVQPAAYYVYIWRRKS